MHQVKVSRCNADKLTEEVRKGGDALDLLLRKAKSTLRALDVELTGIEETKRAPVMLPPASLTEARAALVVDPGEGAAEAQRPEAVAS
ncbi:MAG TPA: hypothetical protein VHB21_06395 [Minicystis sp.]|nr:hypothetical protein [Minicystis sp.]